MAKTITRRLPPDLAHHPIHLNARFSVGADGLQWILYRRRPGRPEHLGNAIGFFMTKDGLLANLGYAYYGVGEINPEAQARLDALPRHYDAPTTADNKFRLA